MKDTNTEKPQSEPEFRFSNSNVLLTDEWDDGELNAAIVVAEAQSFYRLVTQ